MKELEAPERVGWVARCVYYWRGFFFVFFGEFHKSSRPRGCAVYRLVAVRLRDGHLEMESQWSLKTNEFSTSPLVYLGSARCPIFVQVAPTLEKYRLIAFVREKLTTLSNFKPFVARSIKPATRIHGFCIDVKASVLRILCSTSELDHDEPEVWTVDMKVKL